MKMYILDRNERLGIDNKQMGLRYFRDKLYEELTEINVEVDMIILNGEDERIFDLYQELDDLKQAVESAQYNIRHNYNIDGDMEHERHNAKLQQRGWIPAGYYSYEFKEACTFDE